MEKKISVMEIERFAIHDGPGIRTTVFLQGCPLRCLWCANPESQVIGKHLLYFENKCVGCGACAKACQYEAITFENNKPSFHREKCVQCLKCEEACPQNAIRFSGEEMTADDIMSVILRDKDYYENSGGGVTISGGEPFFQFEGFIELLKKCKESLIHTAVETCGQTSLDKIKQAIPYLDLFLFDLKHTNSQKLKEYTGGDLNLILGNIKYIASIDPKKIIIRVPVIPEFNYDEETLSSIFNIALDCGIEKVHLLPYHVLGLSKYEQLGKPYEFKCKKSLYKEDLLIFKKLDEGKGLSVQIGG